MSAGATGEMLLSCLRALGSTTTLQETAERYFTEPEEIAALRWLKEYVRQHRAFPTISTFQRETGITVRITNEPLTYYLDRARKRAIYKHINARFNEIKATLVDKDPDRFIELTAEISANAARFEFNTDETNFSEAMQRVNAEYTEVKHTAGLRGIDTGYEFLNSETGGWQNTDNVAIVGRTGDGKSWILAIHAFAAWQAGFSVLLQSNEMGVLQIARRMVAYHSRINPKSIIRGRISTHNEERFMRSVAALSSSEIPFHCYAGSLTSSTGKLRALCDKHHPDIIMVDASYLLTPEKRGANRRENLVDVANDLKRISIDYNRPLIHTVQFNRQAVRSKANEEEAPDASPREAVPQRQAVDAGVTDDRYDVPESEEAVRHQRTDYANVSHIGLHKIAETDAVAANASIVIALSRPRGRHYHNRRYYQILKGREGEQGLWQIHYDFRTMDFSEVREDDDDEELRRERAPLTNHMQEE
jgi:replicative DNA helicase